MKIARAAIGCLLAAALFSLPRPSGAVVQEEVAGFWTLELKPGFNLVSFPVLPDTPTLVRVIGDAAGAVEVTTWDGRLGGYRWAKFDPRTGQWSGNLFLLDRGAAYWIYLPDADRTVRLTVTGHPEVYTRPRWSSLGRGWKFYAPTIGREQPIDELPPASTGDLLLAWNRDRARFELAESTPGLKWRSAGFDRFLPDRGYMLYIDTEPLPAAGPVDWRRAVLRERMRRLGPPRDDEGGDEAHFTAPPRPLVVGNRTGLPVCDPEGRVCTGGFAVEVVRETARAAPDGGIEPLFESMGFYNIPPGGAAGGRFQVALTVGSTGCFLHPGDRVYLSLIHI